MRFVPSVRLTCASFLFAFLLQTTGRAQDAPTLTDEQAATLATLDPKTVGEIVTLVERYQAWKGELDKLRQLRDDPNTAERIRKAVRQDVERYTATASQKVRQQLPVLVELEALVQKPEEFEKFQQLLETKLKAQLDVVRDPAKYAQTFLADLAKRYTTEPYPVTDDLKVRLAVNDLQASPFSADAGLTAVLEYREPKVSVKATGVFFRYRKGAAPELVLDDPKVKVDTSALQALASSVLPSLGSFLPANSLPIQVEKIEFNGFEAAKGKERGSLSVQIALGFGEFLKLPDVKSLRMSAGCTIYPNGTIRPNGPLTLTIDKPVLVAPGVILDGGKLEYNPAGGKDAIEITTWIAPAAGGKNGVALEVTIGAGFPLAENGLSYKGSLKMARGGLSLGKVEGVITREKVTCRLRFPDPDSKFVADLKVFSVNADLTLDASGLKGKGSMKGFMGLGAEDVEFFLGTNGDGWMAMSRKFDLAGAVKVDGSLSGSFKPGFKQMNLDGAFTVKVGLEHLGHVEAALEVRASVLTGLTTGKTVPSIHVSGHALGVPVDFHCDDFNKIPDEIKKKLLAVRDLLFKKLAEAEKAVAKYAADREAALKCWVYQNARNLGIDSVKTGIPGIDGALGDVSNALKDTGGKLTDLREATGKVLTQGRDTLTQGASDAGQGVVDVLTKPPSETLGGLVGGLGVRSSGVPGLGLTGNAPARRVGKVAASSNGFNLKIDDAIDDAAKKASELAEEVSRREQANRRLKKLMDQMDRIAISREKHGKTGVVSELRLAVDRTLAHPEGTGDAVLTFGIQASGYKYTIGEKGQGTTKPDAGSDVKIGQVRLKGLYRKGRPQADVVIPRLNHSSNWNAEKLLEDEIIELIEKLVPNADIEGRQQERQLAIFNRSDEPLSVCVQAYTRQSGSWKWAPEGPGEEKDSYTYVIPPKKKIALKTKDGAMLTGARARVWAESESGRIWTEYLKKDLVLVDEKDADGHPVYFSDEPEYFVYSLVPSSGMRTMRERVIRVKNETKEPLLVMAHALARDADGKDWDKLPRPLKVEPGKTVKLYQANGWALRGSEVKIWAGDESNDSLRWLRFRETGFKQVDAKGYKAETIGSCTYVFEPPDRQGKTDEEVTQTPSGLGQTVRLPATHVRVPDYKGKRYNESREELIRLGMKPVGGSASSATVKVMAQRPEPGWLEPGTDVRLTPEIVTVKVPDFDGLTLEAARDKGRDLGLEVKDEDPGKVQTRVTKNTSYIGKVLVVSQSVTAGKEVPRGSVVEVALARFVAPPPEKVPVPDLGGLSLEKAITRGREAGLTVRDAGPEAGFVRETTDERLIGTATVGGQSEPAGRMVEKGAVVEVRLVRYVAARPKPVTVPSFMNLTLEEAQARARTAGVEVRNAKPGLVTTRLTQDRNLDNKTVVVTQSVQEGQQVPRGTVVDVTLARFMLPRR